MNQPWKFFTRIGALLSLALAVTSCSDSSSPAGRPPFFSFDPAKAPVVPRSVTTLAKECNIVEHYVPYGKYCRRAPKKITPRYITIHSTQNRSADAWQHARALDNGRIRGGKIGYLSWHFTVDQYVSVQHLPIREMGHHADYGGPGNKYSIGIEMCEHRGNSLPKTLDRTAKLTAILMKKENIPLRNVVPHYYWTKKKCPVPLLDNGYPGYKWKWFLSRVDYYYRCMNGNQSFLDT